MEDNKNNNIGYIVLSILFIFVSIGIAFYLLVRINTSDNKEKDNVNTKKDINTNTSDINLDDNYTKLGNDTFGYIIIKDNWIINPEFTNDNELSYKLDDIWLVTFELKDINEETKSAEYSASLAMFYRSNTGTKIQNITPKIFEYNNIKFYEISYYYVDYNKYLKEWYFEPGDGKIHAILIEGDNDNSEYFESIKTFSLK